MLLRTKLHGKTYEFPDLRLLMGKANEEKSGDRLAGVGAETTAEGAAGQVVVADVPPSAPRPPPPPPPQPHTPPTPPRRGAGLSLFVCLGGSPPGGGGAWVIGINPVDD